MFTIILDFFKVMDICNFTKPTFVDLRLFSVKCKAKSSEKILIPLNLNLLKIFYLFIFYFVSLFFIF